MHYDLQLYDTGLVKTLTRKLIAIFIKKPMKWRSILHFITFFLELRDIPDIKQYFPNSTMHANATTQKGSIIIMFTDSNLQLISGHRPNRRHFFEVLPPGLRVRVQAKANS